MWKLSFAVRLIINAVLLIDWFYGYFSHFNRQNPSDLTFQRNDRSPFSPAIALICLLFNNSLGAVDAKGVTGDTNAQANIHKVFALGKQTRLPTSLPDSTKLRT